MQRYPARCAEICHTECHNARLWRAMSADRGMTQPTMDDLRAELVWRGKYAAAPGSGPKDRTCHDCAFLRYMRAPARHPKCAKTRYTHGDATTIKTRTPACRLFAERAP